MDAEDEPTRPLPPVRARRPVRWRPRPPSDWYRETSFVPTGETVVVDERQHGVALVPPVTRSLAGLLLLVVGPSLGAVLVSVLATAWWAHLRLRRDWRSALVLGGVVALGLVLVRDSPGWWALAAVGMWVWLADDVLDWANDRLVITDKRVYRHHGWVTSHAPSMALANAVFVDVVRTPLDRVFRCGTLRFDSAAQRDAPLARFPLVPEVQHVHHKILELRSRAFR